MGLTTQSMITSSASHGFLLIGDAPCRFMVHKLPACSPALQVLALSATFAPEAKLRVERLMHKPLHVEVDVLETVSLLGVRQFYRTVEWQQEGTAAVHGQICHQACKDVRSVTIILNSRGEAGGCGCPLSAKLCVCAQRHLCSVYAASYLLNSIR